MPSHPDGRYDASSISGTHGFFCSCTSAEQRKITASQAHDRSLQDAFYALHCIAARAQNGGGKDAHVPSSRQLALPCTSATPTAACERCRPAAAERHGEHLRSRTRLVSLRNADQNAVRVLYRRRHGIERRARHHLRVHPHAKATLAHAGRDAQHRALDIPLVPAIHTRSNPPRASSAELPAVCVIRLACMSPAHRGQLTRS